ncbi:MAG: hypothetical protein ACPGO5_05350 [Patescibacteria group bacterium]
MQKSIVYSDDLAALGIKIWVTTREFGNMRIKDLTAEQLLRSMGEIRETARFNGKIISPIPGLSSSIFDATNMDLDDSIVPYGQINRTKSFHDGAIVGRSLPHHGYLLANADCPIGIIVGKEAGCTVAICIHLALQCIRGGIIAKAFELLKYYFDEVSAFYYGFGIGPEKYQFSLTHPKFGEKNKELKSWIEGLGITVPVSEENIPIDLFAITEKIVRSYFSGPIIREANYPCTASAMENGEYLFYSNARCRGTNEALHRNAVLVTTL